MILALLALLAGLVLLMWAGDHFVSGASQLATALRIRPAVIGAVVLGFGTSAPEMVVSSLAAINGEPALGVGNIVGSNVANVSLGLGVAALLMPIPFSRTALRRDVPWSVATAAIFALLVVDGNLSRVEGGLLAVLMAFTLVWLVRSSRDDTLGPDAVTSPVAQDAGRPLTSLIRALLGLFGVILGAQFAVEGATALAEHWGLSDGFIGFSVVAVGTSGRDSGQARTVRRGVAGTDDREGRFVKQMGETLDDNERWGVGDGGERGWIAGVGDGQIVRAGRLSGREFALGFGA